MTGMIFSALIWPMLMIICTLFATLIYGVRDIEDKIKYKITHTGMAMIVISTKIKQGRQNYLDPPPSFCKIPNILLEPYFRIEAEFKVYSSPLIYRHLCLYDVYLVVTRRPANPRRASVTPSFNLRQPWRHNTLMTTG